MNHFCWFNPRFQPHVRLSVWIKAYYAIFFGVAHPINPIYFDVSRRGLHIYTSSTRTRRGGSCLKDIYIYKTFLIYRTCMRRAPAKPVRACTLRKLCPASHVTCEAPLRTSHFSLQSSHSALHTSHSTLHTALLRLHTSHSTRHTPHFTRHTALFALQTSHFTVHTSHFTVHTSHFSLLTAFFTLTTSHFTLHTALFTPHTSHCTLHTPHFISSEPFSPYPSSSLLISSLLICHLSFHESLPSTTTNHCRSLDAPTPIRFTIFSCKIQEYYVFSRGTKQP